jgi:membrane fusion protein (multidrug efflux system)
LGGIVGGIVWFKYFRDDMIAQFLAGMTPPPVPVSVITVEPVTWEPGIDAVGTALAVKGVDLAVESGGLVRAVMFAPNDKISADQPLVQIDDDGQTASLNAAKAALVLAEAEAKRVLTLSERGVSAASQVESATAQVESARAQVAQAQTILDSKKMVAPFAGVIGISHIEVGEYVVAGTIFATLQDLSRMHVDFSVPEQQLADLALGGRVTVTTEVGDVSETGSITAIEPRIDPNSRMVSVRAEVNNEGGRLYPGQFLRVRIAQPKEDGVIAVPQTAVSSSLYGDTIFVIRPGDADGELKAEQVFVTLGRRVEDRIEVIEGLQPGDQIATSGQNRLSNGSKVKIDDSVELVEPDGAVRQEPPANGEAAAGGAAAPDAAVNE